AGVFVSCPASMVQTSTAKGPPSALPLLGAGRQRSSAARAAWIARESETDGQKRKAGRGVGVMAVLCGKIRAHGRPRPPSAQVAPRDRPILLAEQEVADPKSRWQRCHDLVSAVVSLC